MKNQSRSMNLIVPDINVLNTLSGAGLLHVLLPHFVITDVVTFCANTQAAAFIQEHADAVNIERTSFHEQIRMAKADPNFPLPADMGELSIYSYLFEIARAKPDVRALVILDDNWFNENQTGTMPPGVQLVSLSAFMVKNKAAT